MEHELKRELDFAIRTAREAGAIIMELAKPGIGIRQKSQLRGDVVTDADMASDSHIIKKIRESFPGDAILTEESADDRSRLKSSRVWIIDPIDGTKNYSDFALSGCTEKKFQYFAVHIGLSVDGAPVVGVVYAPATDELFYAARGSGAYKVTGSAKPVRLSVDATGAEKHDVVFNSNVYETEGTAKMTSGFPILKRQFGVVYGYYLAAIAERRMDAYVISCKRFCLSEWDSCAPQVVLEEAGGVVISLKGEKLGYNKEEPLFRPGVIAEARKGIVPLMD